MPENYSAFAVLTALVSLMPGPAMLFVMSQAAWRGPRAGLSAGAGIQGANVIYYALSGFGLAGLIAASGTAFLAIKWLGALYLAWLGALAIHHSFRKDIAAPTASGRRSLNALGDGLFVGLSNPKAILYFVALLPQFIDPGRPILSQIVILGITGISLDLVAIALYAFAGGALSKALGRPGVRRWFERGVGGVFLGLSALTALVRRAA